MFECLARKTGIFLAGKQIFECLARKTGIFLAGKQIFKCLARKTGIFLAGKQIFECLARKTDIFLAGKQMFECLARKTDIFLAGKQMLGDSIIVWLIAFPIRPFSWRIFMISSAMSGTAQKYNSRSILKLIIGTITITLECPTICSQDFPDSAMRA